MRSRCMSLLPRTTLHSDSEQFIYNWMLEDDLNLDWGDWRKLNGRQGNGKVMGSIHANYHRQVPVPWQSCWIKVQQKRHRRNKGKRANQNASQVVMWIHAIPWQSCWIKVQQKRHGRKGRNATQVVLNNTQTKGIMQTKSCWTTRKQKGVMQIGRI